MALKLTKRNGIYYATGTVAGQRIRQSTKTGELQWAKNVAREIEQAAWLRTQQENEPVPFEVACVSYLEADKERRFLEPLIRYFRGMDVAKIKPGHIQDAARKLYPGAATSTWNRQVITPTRAVINHASERGWCAPIRVKRFEEEAPQRKAADREWLDAFMANADPHRAALALFMFTTGARISEALSVDWDDIDGRSVVFDTKTGMRKAILAREFLSMLSSIPRLNDRVFYYKSRSSIYNGWYAICETAGIEKIPPHQAGRHAFATEMIVRNAVDAKTAAQLGGWKSTRMLMDRYAHPEGLEDTVDAVFEKPAPRDVRKGKSSK